MSELFCEVKFDRRFLPRYYFRVSHSKEQIVRLATACLILAALFAPHPAAFARDVRTFSEGAIELKVDCVPGEAGEGICATCVVTATNRTEDVFGRGGHHRLNPPGGRGAGEGVSGEKEGAPQRLADHE